MRVEGSDLSLLMLADLLLQVSHIDLQLGPFGIPVCSLVRRLLPLLFQVCQIALRICRQCHFSINIHLKL